MKYGIFQSTFDLIRKMTNQFDIHANSGSRILFKQSAKASVAEDQSKVINRWIKTLRNILCGCNLKTT